MRSSSVDIFAVNFHKVTFEILRVLTMNIAIFGDVMPCRLIVFVVLTNGKTRRSDAYGSCPFACEPARWHFLRRITSKTWLWTTSAIDTCCTDSRIVFTGWYFGVAKFEFKHISLKLSPEFSDLYFLVNEKLYSMYSVTIQPYITPQYNQARDSFRFVYSSLTNKCTFINLKKTLKFTFKYT